MKFDWDSLAKPEGLSRLRRLVCAALVHGQLKLGVARFLLDQSDSVRNSMPQKSATKELLERVLAEPPPHEDNDEESNAAIS